MSGPNRETRRRMARDLRRAGEAAPRTLPQGHLAVPVAEPRLRAALRTLLDEMEARPAPTTPTELAGLAHDDDLAAVCTLALADLDHRMSGDPVDPRAVPAHVMAWGIVIGRELADPRSGLRAMRARRDRADD